MYFISVDVANMKPDRQTIYNEHFLASINFVYIFICVYMYP